MPVGQGGLHVGALSWSGIGGAADPANLFTHADFLYVYDCGSEPKRHVNREIKGLVEARPCRSLDLLVLSHFDRDHICGTPRLLHKSNGLKVDTILLPFVDMDERIVALAQAAAETEDYGGRIDGFFLDMVFDPVAALSRFEPRRIIFVRSGDDDAPLDGDGPPDADPGSSGMREEMKGYRTRERGPGPIKTSLVGAYGDPQRPPRHVYRGQSGGTEVLEVRNVALALADAGYSVEWKLLPWVRPAAAADVASFRSMVETLFGWPKGTFGSKILDPAVRKQMVTSKRTKLAAAYKLAFADKNLTSLCLYSGPRDPRRLAATAITPRLGYHRLTKIGWLGTGDAHLKDRADIVAFRQAYAQDIDFVSTYLFPHHGSIENSDPSNLIVDADLWVAAADPIHPWLHPHWKLERAVHRRGKMFRHVRASPATGATEVFLAIARP
jgi:hypothetical protein